MTTSFGSILYIHLYNDFKLRDGSKNRSLKIKTGFEKIHSFPLTLNVETIEIKHTPRIIVRYTIFNSRTKRKTNFILLK